MGAAVVLCPGHLYCRVVVESYADGICADALIVPERTGYKAQVLGFGHYALVAHRLKHVPYAVGQHHQESRAPYYIKHALHYGHCSLNEVRIGLAYAAKNFVVHPASQAADRVHACLLAASPPRSHCRLYRIVHLALIDEFGPYLFEFSQVFHLAPLQKLQKGRTVKYMARPV